MHLAIVACISFKKNSIDSKTYLYMRIFHDRLKSFLQQWFLHFYSESFILVSNFVFCLDKLDCVYVFVRATFLAIPNLIFKCLSLQWLAKVYLFDIVI